jgi:archaemetzincin
VPIFMSDRLDLMDRLGASLGKSLEAEVHRRSPSFDPELAFDAARGQYNSTILLRLLLVEMAESSDLILGVTSVDLFVPVLTYVFGEAQLGGRAAVVSLNRLLPEVYGLPQDDELLCDRLLKEAVHEMGHCFGLVHCSNPACVMRSSTYVEEIDLKQSWYCPTCEQTVSASERTP